MKTIKAISLEAVHTHTHTDSLVNKKYMNKDSNKTY